MTAFEWIIVTLVFLGLVVPAWLFALAVFIAAKRPKGNEPSARYFAYSRLMNYLRDEVQEGVVGFGPLWVATVRELRDYPEFADVSILYLEEISVTGSNKFDRIMEQELKEAETFLLGLQNE